MAQSNPTVPQPKMWRAITQKVLDLLAPNVTIVASPPFFKDEKWSILYGDDCRYRIYEYPNERMVWREFRAIENAVLLDCGYPSCDFHLLDSQEAAKIVDLESYRAAVGRGQNRQR